MMQDVLVLSDMNIHPALLKSRRTRITTLQRQLITTPNRQPFYLLCHIRLHGHIPQLPGHLPGHLPDRSRIRPPQLSLTLVQLLSPLLEQQQILPTTTFPQTLPNRLFPQLDRKSVV